MWTKEKLSALSKQTKTITVCGDEMIIRKLKISEIMKQDSDVNKSSLEMISASLVEPALTVDEVKELPSEMIEVFTEEIKKFNHLDKEANQGN